MALKGNKGEWSEVYVLLKLLGEKKLYSGDENLDKVANLYYPILEIIREEQNKKHEYALDGDIVVINEDGNTLVKVSVKDFLENAKILLASLKKAKGRAFSIPQIQNFLDEIYCTRLKASSLDKADITVVVHDPRTGINPTLGFSIKSYIGGLPTLLNPGEPTNFIYRITHLDLSDEEIDQINAINSRSKIQDRVKAIKEKGGIIEYDSMQNRTFRNNLTLIDSCMPNIISEILLEFYSTDMVSISDLVDNISKENPLHFDLSQNQPFYEHKVKQLLVDIALGVTPATPWNGVYDANGGYIVVKENGELLCYHIYDRNLFENYLFKNTKLVSASSTRYGYGQIIRINGQLCIKLNLQIRFR